MKNKKIIYTTLLISTVMAIVVNLITPDLYTMLNFNQIGEKQLFTYGLIGFGAAVIMALWLKMRKKR